MAAENFAHWTGAPLARLTAQARYVAFHCADTYSTDGSKTPYYESIELVESFSHLGRSKGGYWEDRGYHWYAGI